MTDAEAYAILQAAFNKVFERSDIKMTSDLTAKDVIGWDSLKQLDLIMEIEDRLEVEISGEMLRDLPNVGRLINLIKLEAAAKALRSKQ